MKKNIITIFPLLSALLSASCDNVNTSVEENIYNFDTIYISIDGYFNLRENSKEEYKNNFYDILIDDNSIIQSDMYDNIIGMKLGETTIKVIIDEIYEEELKVIVTDDVSLLNKRFIETPLINQNLKGKTISVFGGSISDLNDNAYPNNDPKSWCELLSEQYDLTMHNFAIGGSTLGYSKKLMERGDFLHIIGTSKVNVKENMEKVAESDYVFIYLGSNDCTYAVRIGEIGEINDENRNNTESFKGAYSYMINKIREVNKDAKIICVSLSPSTWGEPAYTRQYMCDAIKDVANKMSCKYAYVYDAWKQSEFSICCPDGIHPQSLGHEKILQKILES